MDWYARFDALEPDTPRLLLAHNPDAVYLPGRKPLAVLSGHTHGGQIMLLDWVSRPLHRWIHPAPAAGQRRHLGGLPDGQWADTDCQPGHRRLGAAPAPAASPGSGCRDISVAGSH